MKGVYGNYFLKFGIFLHRRNSTIKMENSNMYYNHIIKIFNIAVDLIFPRYLKCISCNKELEKKYRYSICNQCFKKLVFVDEAKACRVCGKGLYINDDRLLCKECEIHKPYFNKGFSVVLYNETAKSMIHGIKYKNKRYIAYYMANMMMDKLKNHYLKYDIVMYVPLYYKKEKHRGYNQAKILAKYISKGLDIPLNHGLIRLRHTKEMNKLTKRLRRINLLNAFGVIDDNQLKNKHILLIDDVYTTGTTTDECAKVLLKNGVKKVDVLTFAIGISS